MFPTNIFLHAKNHIWTINTTFPGQEDVDGDVHKDNQGDVDDKKEEPNINVLKIGSLWEWCIDRGQEGGKNQQAGESTHEAVAKICDVDEERKIGNEPEKKWLEKCCWNCLHVEPSSLML